MKDESCNFIYVCDAHLIVQLMQQQRIGDLYALIIECSLHFDFVFYLKEAVKSKSYQPKLQKDIQI